MPRHPALFRFDTYPASALRAVAGANEGDPIGAGDAAVPGDMYRLRSGSAPERLAVSDDPAAGACVADGSAVGAAGTGIAISACATFMGEDGRPVEVLLVELGKDILILPLAPLRSGTDYELVTCSAEAAPSRFEDIASASFLAGTNLTMADGRQVPVEELKTGDRLLTRFNGPRPIRWIGHRTLRATGAAAPVRITAGTLNVSRDLRLAPQHRLYVWQRHDTLDAGRSEVLVRAESLVNGTTVLREEGGHLDSYQIVFDGHEIIYAEGIAVESMLVAGPAPRDIDLGPARAEQLQASELEVDEAAIGPDAADRLARASRGEPG